MVGRDHPRLRKEPGQNFANWGQHSRALPGIHCPLRIVRYPLPYSLFVPCYSLPVTRYLLPVTRYPLTVTCYPLPVSRYPFPGARYPFLISCYLNLQPQILEFSTNADVVFVRVLAIVHSGGHEPLHARNRVLGLSRDSIL